MEYIQRNWLIMAGGKLILHRPTRQPQTHNLLDPLTMSHPTSAKETKAAMTSSNSYKEGASKKTQDVLRTISELLSQSDLQVHEPSKKPAARPSHSPSPFTTRINSEAMSSRSIIEGFNDGSKGSTDQLQPMLDTSKGSPQFSTTSKKLNISFGMMERKEGQSFTVGFR